MRDCPGGGGECDVQSMPLSKCQGQCSRNGCAGTAGGVLLQRREWAGSLHTVNVRAPEGPRCASSERGWGLTPALFTPLPLRSYCGLEWRVEGAQPGCACHQGYDGQACEVFDNRCPLKCSERGTCLDTQFCHCEPPHFSAGCSRSNARPANASLPSPVDFKIYMYELSSELAYERMSWVGMQDQEAQ